MAPSFLLRYLKARAASGPWRLEGGADRPFAGAIVIPALAEAEHLFATLRTLEAQPPEFRERFLTVVVVNHRSDADSLKKADNLRTLERLAAGEGNAELPLAWVDAVSPGRELPAGEGVGLARKIGCDLALGRLDWGGTPPLLLFLDADALVDPRYLPAVVRHFETAPEGGGVLPFAHRPGETPAHQAAIARYELFLRSYVFGLSLAGSPYAFHTVGSTIACRAEVYVRSGGMNRRLAGEDFYFLQQLAKTAGVAEVRGTVVRPSPRVSDRAPFGTGRSVGRHLAGEEEVSFYRPEVFRLLGSWLKEAAAELAAGGGGLPEVAGRAHPVVADFLAAEGFPESWERIVRNARGSARARAFHGWFDGLKTLRLVHRLCGVYPRCRPEEAVPPLLAEAGLPALRDVGGQLALMRSLQGVSQED